MDLERPSISPRRAVLSTSLPGISKAEQVLQDGAGATRFHELDLALIASATESAKRFREIEGRIDILVANAGISLVSLDKLLSPDGYERIFATNHMGHFAFSTSLFGKLLLSAAVRSPPLTYHLDVVGATSTRIGDARIVVTGSTLI